MSAIIQHQIMPQLGEGVFIIKDVARILRLDYDKVRRWILGYWDHALKEDCNYTFGDKGSKAINFLSLIEFYTFFKLREKGVSAAQIRSLHEELSHKLGTIYPFAIGKDFFVENRNRKKLVFVDFADALWKNDKKEQLHFRFLEAFLEKVEFNEDNLATRFFPLGKEKNVVVDPKHQFGQPTISGTNIKTQTIFNLHKGGETNENISTLYDIPVEKVRDAIAFHKSAA